MAFATLVMAQLIHVFDCRCSISIFHRNIFENKYLLLAVFISLIMMIGVIYVEPLQPIFRTVDLNGLDWITVLIAGAIPSLVFGFGKVFKR